MLQTNGTVIPLAQFTDFSVAIATSTLLDTSYEATSATTFVGDTSTAAPYPVTEYAACATNNFANAVLTGPNNFEYINSLRFESELGNGGFNFDLGPTNPTDCCVYALKAKADIWTFGFIFGCGVAYNVNGVCDPKTKNKTAVTTNQPSAQDIIIGNSLCASFTELEIDEQ